MCQDPKKGDVPVCILVTLAPKIEIKGKIRHLRICIYEYGDQHRGFRRSSSVRSLDTGKRAGDELKGGKSNETFIYAANIFVQHCWTCRIVHLLIAQSSQHTSDVSLNACGQRLSKHR